MLADIVANAPCLRAESCEYSLSIDHEDCVRSLARMLELEKFDVCIAFDGSSAIRTALAFRPEVVLLDLFMPDVSGIDVAKLLRQLPDFDDVLLIAITGCRDAALTQEMRSIGMNHVLRKPCDFEELLAILQSICTKNSCVESAWSGE